MLKAADHLKKVKRMRVSEKDVASLLPHYEVRLLNIPFDSVLTRT
jgi:ATP-dependent RNA helicase DDX51/DBP6